MWREKRLDELADIVSGGTPSREIEIFWDGDIPWVTPTDITARKGNYLYQTRECISDEGLRKSSAKLLPKGTILFTSRATVGESCISASPMCTNQGFKSLVAKPDVDNRFLFYSVTLSASKFKRYAVGSTFPEINKGDTARVELNIPDDKVEQEKIADILETADEAIEQTETLIAKYEQIKQGMMQDLFSRGVDKNCQLRPSYEEAPHLYKDSELGWVPMTWNVEPLVYFVPRAEYGISISLSDDEQTVPVLRMNNIANGEFDVTGLKYAPFAEVSRFLVKTNDVLFNRTNSWEHVGKTALWRDQLLEASFASYLVRLVPDRERITPDFLSFWLQQDNIQTVIRRFATPGVQQVNINPTNLRRTVCAAPSELGEQRRIVAKIDSIDGYISKETKVLSKLKAEKAGLMQDLLTGKVPVSFDQAEPVEAVA